MSTVSYVSRGACVCSEQEQVAADQSTTTLDQTVDRDAAVVTGLVILRITDHFYQSLTIDESSHSSIMYVSMSVWLVQTRTKVFNVYLANYLRQPFFDLTCHFNRRVFLGYS